MGASARELEARLLQASEEEGRLAILLELARAHAAAFRNREGLRAAREALSIARRRGDTLAIGRALSTATLCHYQRGDYVAAVATGLDAVEAYADGDLGGRSRALQSIALALFSVDAFAGAESAARRAVDDARAAKDPEREAYAGNVLGYIICDRGHFNEARRLFRYSAHYFRLSGDVLRLKKSTSYLGHAYRRQGNMLERGGHMGQARIEWGRAISVYRIAAGIAVHEADDAFIVGEMAECQCRLGRFQEAYATIASAIELARAVNNVQVLANCHLWEGHSLEGMGELEAAERAFDRAVKAAAPLEYDAVLSNALRSLAAIVARRGDGDRASLVLAGATAAQDARTAFFTRVRTELRDVLPAKAGLKGLDKLDA